MTTEIKKTSSGNTGEKTMSSLDIAAVTGKPHKDVLKAIRIMEQAWENECGRKFSLTSERVKMPQGGVRLIPMFSLTKTESLYVATKFNDEARARLVLRWEQLERENLLKNKKGQRLLETEADILQRSDELRRESISKENAEADGCYCVKDIARMLHTTVKTLNKKLTEMGIQYWQNGRYHLTEGYQGLDYGRDRNFHYYGLNGEKKESTYLVWTPLGMEFIRTII